MGNWPTRGDVLVSWLPSVLENSSNHQVSCCGIRSPVITTISYPGSGCTAHDTGDPIKVSQLSSTFWRESLACVLLTRVCHETPLRMPDM